MKKVFILTVFALFFGVAYNVTTNAQTETIKKVAIVTKDTSVAGAKKTNSGVRKGWRISKRTGKKVWSKTTGATKKTYKVTKTIVKKIT